MNVCMISHSFYDYDGRVRRAAEALTEREDDVDVICLRGRDGEKRCVVNGVTVYSPKRRSQNERQVTDYVFSLLGFFLSSAYWATKLHFRKKYDVVYVHNLPDFLVFAAVIPKLLGSKIILDIHDMVPEFYAQKFKVGEGHILVRLLKWVEKLSTVFSDHVIVANHIWADALARRSVNGERVSVILNSPDDVLFYPTTGRRKVITGAFTMEYHGSLKEHFGVEVAIRAMDILRSEIPDIKLKIVGAGPLREELIELVSQLNLKGFVDILEPLPLEEVRDFVTQADLGVVPKKRGIFSDNALSTKLLELVKLGIPAVVSRAPVEQNYFDEDMVMFFEPDSPEDLAKAVIELYKSPEKRKELVRKANLFNKKHNWEHYREIYYKLIDELCTNSTQ